MGKFLHIPVFVDADECKENNGGCDSKRKCVNTHGGHKCEDCPTGWVNDGDLGCKGLLVSTGRFLLQTVVAMLFKEMSTLAIKHAHTFGCRPERVHSKTHRSEGWRVRYRKRVYKHAGRLQMWRLPTWMGQSWHGCLHRYMPCSTRLAIY